MEIRLEDLMQNARTLPRVSLKAATEYRNLSDALIRFVDDSMDGHPDLNRLIGHNSLQTMHDNHRNHAALMGTVFALGSPDLLIKTIPWVYRSYHAHRFSFDYFPTVLRTWIRAVESHFSEKIKASGDMEAIIALYQWLIDNHEKMIRLSRESLETTPPVIPDWLDTQKTFLHALLEGNHRQCLRIAELKIRNPGDLEAFYLQIIQPAMVEIGMRWESAEISVAQEHLASAIVGRVMAAYGLRQTEVQSARGRAVITASANEYHEIGPWMISDFLEQDGWDVRYLGANTPVADLIDLLESFSPHLIAMSVTMPFNVIHAREAIEAVRSHTSLKDTHILVGGQVFNANPELWKTIGADGHATDAEAARRLARAWWNKIGSP